MRFTDRVVLITGGARGQGRSHAVEFAREGADVVVVDLCDDLETSYPSPTYDDLLETQRLVEEQGRRCMARRADVCVFADLEATVAEVLERFGRLDVLVANAGILHNSGVVNLTTHDFERVLATNLGGVFNAVKAVVPTMLAQQYGRIIATSSMAGRRAYGGSPHYAASKWAVIGFVKDVALELAETGITVNAVCPATVNTPMAVNEALFRRFLPDLEAPTLEDFKVASARLHPQNIPYLEPADVSHTVLHLASEQARHITGDVLTVSAGMMAQNSS